MLEALALLSPLGEVSFADLLVSSSGRLQRGTSVLAVASDYPEPTLVALAELRRHHAVTAVFVDCGSGAPPPKGTVDAVLTARYTDDWQERQVLELTT